MPNQDGSLIPADRIRVAQALNRMIPADNPELSPKSLGILDAIEVQTGTDESIRTAFIRFVELLSLDLMAHAVGGFTAMTEEEQIDALLTIERTLPMEFGIVLSTARDAYYADSRTPDRPEKFEHEQYAFGKIDPEPQVNTPHSGQRLVRWAARSGSAFN